MSDNPFAEPDESDRTVIRPGIRPGPKPGLGRPGAAAPSPALPAPAAAAPGSGPQEAPLTGTTPLLAAAGPLLQLLGRLRNTMTAPDTNDLRARAVREVQAFEQRARAAEVPVEQLRPAHYALCASLDDVVLSTPWGGGGGWDRSSLVVTFHQGVDAGEGFFDLLAKLRQHPGRFLPVLELMYLCLSLGFQGRYRLSPRGPGEIDRLREELYALIVRQRGPGKAAALSPQWQGVSAPYRPLRAVIPAWVVGATALGVLGTLFLWSTLSANALSDGAFQRLATAPPDHMPRLARQVRPVAPALPEATALDQLRAFLKPEIEAGLVTVVGTPATPIVRIRGSGLFPSASAALQPRFNSLLERIGAALKAERGSVRVVGYTDNQAIRTVKFPSNFQLSAARAQAAAAVIGRTIGEAGRIRSEGRAEAEPIASNDTAEGRDQNRRIEVVLERQP